MLKFWAVPLVALGLLCATGGLAAVPGISQIEGVLHTNGGGPAADGDYALTFALYALPSGGEALWTETAPQVAVVNGQFTWPLGSIKALPAQVLAATSLFMGVKIAADPELPRQPLFAAMRAIRAGVAEALDCSGCVGASHLDAQVLAPFAKSASLAKVATTGAYADLSGQPDLTGFALAAKLKDVATTGAYADLSGKPDLAGFALAAKLKDVAMTGAYADLEGVPVVPKVGTACGSGLVLKGFKADGAFDCVPSVDPSSLPVPTLAAVSKNLLTDEFTDTAASPLAPYAISDNNPIGTPDTIVFPDVGIAKSLSVSIDLVNSDTSTLKVVLYDPTATPHVLWDKGAKATALKATYPAPTKPVAGDLTTWVGKNPKGNWSLVVIDTGFLENKEDGQVLAWSISVTVTSTKKLLATGGLEVLTGLRLPVTAQAPVVCGAKTRGYLYVDDTTDAVRVCRKTGLWGTVSIFECGNGKLENGESCDDGNTKVGDGCDALCVKECGNGKVDPGEDCDPSDPKNALNCSATCKKIVYGKVWFESSDYAWHPVYYPHGTYKESLAVATCKAAGLRLWRDEAGAKSDPDWAYDFNNTHNLGGHDICYKVNYACTNGQEGHTGTWVLFGQDWSDDVKTHAKASNGQTVYVLNHIAHTGSDENNASYCRVTPQASSVSWIDQTNGQPTSAQAVVLCAKAKN